MCYFTGTYVHSVIQEYEIFENSKFTNKPKITNRHVIASTRYVCTKKFRKEPID